MDDYEISQSLSTPSIVGGLPIGKNVTAVMATQRSSISVLGDDIEFSCQAYQRWDQLRGSE
jgi:hypothetical protein